MKDELLREVRASGRRAAHFGRRHVRAGVIGAVAFAAIPAAGYALRGLIRRGGVRPAAGGASDRAATRLLIDNVLPVYDATLVRTLRVEAPPAVTYASIRETNLLDPLVRGLFQIRELPQRLTALARGDAWPEIPRRLTFADLLEREPHPAILADQPDLELVVGSVGRFWQKDYGGRSVSAREFRGFHDPGYARLAMSFRVESLGTAHSLLRFEARTATTDEDARRQFRRYWRVIRPGVALVMGRALALIGAEAESRASSRSVSPRFAGHSTDA